MALGTSLPDCHTREDVLKWLMCHRQWNAALARMEAIGFKAGLEAAALKADAFTKHTCRDERQRFTLTDMQAMMRSAAKAIASDIRTLPIEEPPSS